MDSDSRSTFTACLPRYQILVPRSPSSTRVLAFESTHVVYHDEPGRSGAEHSDVEGQEAHQEPRQCQRVSHLPKSRIYNEFISIVSPSAGTSMISLIIPPKVCSDLS